MGWIFRLYRNNDELGSTNADSAPEAQLQFVNKGVIPADILKEMKFEIGGPTAVMPDGNVWQIRSLLMNIMGGTEPIT
ncbi:hypothetical protein KKF82_07080 [Patescibacteria group bacterium]|uniref:Uncharacterized protein n=1 Tax=viral metagenome TaxID=1070528 RepID=A0A6M3LSP1_9ZZZZ|nr:hypothetical protein [Patescibacteria group bacterium]